MPALVWAAIIYGLSTTSSANLPKFDLLSADKIGHLVFYTGLMFWLLWALRKNAAQGLAATIAALVVAGGYGTALEFVQAYLPDRSFDYADMLANFAGCLLGWLLFDWLWRLSEYFFSFFLKKN